MSDPDLKPGDRVRDKSSGVKGTVQFESQRFPHEFGIQWDSGAFGTWPKSRLEKI